jgi:hypothetical protein
MKASNARKVPEEGQILMNKKYLMYDKYLMDGEYL